MAYQGEVSRLRRQMVKATSAGGAIQVYMLGGRAARIVRSVGGLCNEAWIHYSDRANAQACVNGLNLLAVARMEAGGGDGAQDVGKGPEVHGI